MAFGDEVLSVDEGCVLLLARAGSESTSFRRCATDARAELNWSNLHAGPDFAEASSRQAAYAPVRRDAEVEILTTDSIPARFHFSNFEESVLDRSGRLSS